MFGQNFAAGAGQFLGGLFGDSGSPYEDAMRQYKKYFGQAQQAQNPFYNAGANALGGYQNWLSGMSNPSDFINNLMGKYQESPFAKYEQNQAMRAAQNMGSATGLTGSTPLMQQAQQNAANISSQDMSKWLSNVLGVNTQYGAGMGGLVNTGAGSANSISELLSRLGGMMGEGAYGQRAGQLQDRSNMIGGLMNMFM